MGSSTIGFVSMKNIPSQAAFMESVKTSLRALIQESYDRHNVQRHEMARIPLIRNQATPDHFEYNVIGGREAFCVNFGVFIDPKEFSTESAYYRFNITKKGVRMKAEGEDAIPNEARMLYIISECMDYPEAFEGPKMVLSIGNWGQSETIIKTILENYGAEYYFAQDDCSCNYEKITPEAAKAS